LNAAKKIILLLWLLVVASLGNVSASTPGASENRVWEKSFAALETRLAKPLQTLGSHQENEGAGYDYAVDSLLAAEGGAYSAIGSTGQVGEQWLAQNLGGEPQVFFNTTQGGRYVDQLVGDIANESKVGYQSLTPSIQLQISKDAELLNGGTFQSVNWHFFQSPVTGLGGPSQPLMNALQQNGINVIIH